MMSPRFSIRITFKDKTDTVNEAMEAESGIKALSKVVDNLQLNQVPLNSIKEIFINAR
jgi:hypothetical protein